MKKTTKKENLKIYLINACLNHAQENGKEKPKKWEDVKIYINKIFYEEMIAHNPNKNINYRFSLFKDWIFGLCFCSPIMEDLTRFSNFKKDHIKQENDVFNKIYDLVYIKNFESFKNLILN